MNRYKLSQLCLMVNSEFRQLGYKQRIDFCGFASGPCIIIKESPNYDSKELGRFSPEDIDQGQEIAHAVCKILNK